MSNSGLVRARPLGIVGGLAVIIATVAAAVSISSSGEADPGDLRSQLECGGANIVSTSATHDGETRETRSPAQQANAWATRRASVGALRVGAPTVTYESDARVDLTFTDQAGRTVAAQRFDNRGRLGWILESMVECGTGVKK